MKASETKLVKWLEVRLLAPPLVHSVRLYHANETEDGTRELLVNKFAVRELEGRTSEAAAELAREVHHAAEEHAEAFAETELPQLFNLASYSKTAEGKIRRGACCALRLRDETRSTSLRGPAGRPFGSTEPPTNRGERAQSMRHIEALARIYVDGSTTNLGIMQRLVERLEDANLALSAGMAERIKATAELHDNKHARDMEIAQFVADQDRKGAVAKSVIDTVIPEFARRAIPRMFGDIAAQPGALGDGKPPPELDERAELRALVEGLPSTVAKSVMQAWTPADRGALMEIIGGKGKLSDAERTRTARAVYGLAVGPSEVLAQALGEERSRRLVRIIGPVPADLQQTEGATP